MSSPTARVPSTGKQPLSVPYKLRHGLLTRRSTGRQSLGLPDTRVGVCSHETQHEGDRPLEIGHCESGDAVLSSRAPSVAIRCFRMQSCAIGCNQMPSDAL